jgi:hypothetical protein
MSPKSANFVMTVCHHNTLLIYGSLRVPTLDNWNKVTHASTGLSVIASLVMAVSGYSVFVSVNSLYSNVTLIEMVRIDGQDPGKYSEQLPL